METVETTWANLRARMAQDVKVGDPCHVYGNSGTVEAVNHIIVEGTPCTYIKVDFDENTGLKGTAYDHGFYGCCDVAWDYTGF